MAMLLIHRHMAADRKLMTRRCINLLLISRVSKGGESDHRRFLSKRLALSR